MLDLVLKTSLAQVVKNIERDKKRFNYAAADAVNRAAFHVRRELKSEMLRVFDRPTKFTQNAVWVRRAKPDSAEASATLEFFPNMSFLFFNYLAPQVEGGKREAKRSEKRLRRAGVLPGRRYLAPADSAPKDKYGNVRRGVFTKMLSYLRSFDEAGYTANRVPGTKKKERFFVKRNLGIFRATTRKVSLIFLFVREPRYKKLLDLEKIKAKEQRKIFGYFSESLKREGVL